MTGLRKARVVRHAGDAPGKRGVVPNREQKTVFTRAHRLGDAAQIGSDHRHPMSECLDRHAAECLAANGGEDEQIDLREELLRLAPPQKAGALWRKVLPLDFLLARLSGSRDDKFQ